ncbi:DUF1501 domain-containing protein [Undibacterium sp. TJN19]|uniref:DUF1501 domain-containing protein n=1 Tax=Undibacterium sp. TJN19 TaxID=3413055 RepID=UPI003BF0E425
MTNKSRRDFLSHAGLGLGGLGLGSLTAGGLLGGGLLSSAQAATFDDPLALKVAHHAAKAKSVIWLHMAGAPSTLDLFDYKPDLIKLAGQPMPDSFSKNLKTATDGGVGALYATKRTWKQYGESGAWFSDLVPNIAKQADDICFIKGSKTEGSTHVISSLKLHTSALTPGRPALGAWITYGLGSANPDLPSFVVLPTGYDNSGGGRGQTIWSSGFLPATYQGTVFRQGDSPILHLDRPSLVSSAEQKNTLDLIRKLNAQHASHYPSDSELEARNRSYELAYRMESSAPEAVDLSKESKETKAAYGLDDDASKDYGTNLLRARRLVERGVRFVHVISGSNDKTYGSWDAHNNIEKNHAVMAKSVDKPIGALLADLKARGLLDSTLVVWTSEFGRTPYGQTGDGRDHNPWGYTTWIAGGGSKAGYTHGSTDEIGLRAASGVVDTYDLQATVLHLMGLNHRNLTFTHQGRSERATTVFGDVVKELIA